MSDAAAVILTPVLIVAGILGPRSGHLIETLPVPLYFVFLGFALLVLGVVAIAVVLGALRAALGSQCGLPPRGGERDPRPAPSPGHPRHPLEPCGDHI